MSMQAYRHGGLVALCVSGVVAAAAPPAPHHLPRATSRTFDIEYRINASAFPLAAIELWYTLDAGATWRRHDVDGDAQSPISFTAPQEGQYGFFLIASNEAGRSSEPPTSGTHPQQWAFVDYTPPVVQLHHVRTGATPDTRTLHLKWTAIDAHLDNRPIALAYRQLPDGPWQTIAGAVSNIGRYDWRLPDSLDGDIMIRVSVHDRGGNQVEAVAVVDVGASFPAPQQAGPATHSAQPDTPPATVSQKDLLRARRLYAKGVSHQKRGEHGLAISRFRDALMLDPTLSEALVEMGRALYAVRGFKESARAYELALAQAPRLQSAFRGKAEVSVALHHYGSAAESLHKLLRLYPTDVEAWLYLGDVEMWRGDQIAARENYMKATSLDPDAKEIIARARRRLANMELVRERVGRLVEAEQPKGP